MNEPTTGNIERVPVGAPPPPKKGSSSLVKIILIAIVLGLAVGGAIYFLLPKLQHHAGMVETEVAESPSKDPKPFGEVFELSDIVINPAGSRRVFMVSVALEVSNKEITKEIKKRETLLRDNLITLFASQPLEVLIDIKYRQAFRARVKKVMDFQLGQGAVSRVFFQKWVFQ